MFVVLCSKVHTLGQPWLSVCVCLSVCGCVGIYSYIVDCRYIFNGFEPIFNSFDPLIYQTINLQKWSNFVKNIFIISYIYLYMYLRI